MYTRISLTNFSLLGTDISLCQNSFTSTEGKYCELKPPCKHISVPFKLKTLELTILFFSRRFLLPGNYSLHYCRV